MSKTKTPIEVRFWSRVQKTDDCWLWTGFRMKNGYGTIGSGHGANKRTVHRLSYELANGPIPDGLLVCHKCDVRNCVRPDHLFLGTHADNMADASAKGRTNRSGMPGSKNGRAKLTEDDVRNIMSKLNSGVSCTDLARYHKVSKYTISHIACGHTWTHVTGFSRPTCSKS